MNTQINLRIPENMLSAMKEYSEKNGFGTLQEFIKETIREKLYDEPMLTKEETSLVKRLAKASEKKRLYGTEEELWNRLKRK